MSEQDDYRGDSFTDGTTIRRPMLASNEPAEPYIYVRAVIGRDLDRPWIHDLERLARSRGQMKWETVAGPVLTGTSSELARIREGLQTAAIIIADPAASFRRIDIDLARENRTSPLLVRLLAGTAKTASPSLVRLGRQLREWASERMLDTSVIGEIERLVHEAEFMPIRRLDGLTISAPLGDSLRRSVVNQLGVNLSKITKFAGSSQILRLGGFRDAEPGSDADVVWARPQALRTLDRLGSARIIFDNGESDVTQAVETLRYSVASVARTLSYGRILESGGFIREMDDRAEVRLRVADIAAGFAKAVIGAGGLRAASARFPLMVLNGRAVNADTAHRYDSDRAQLLRLMGL
ncbi:MAG: hypothetical protein JNJ80_17395 [Gemmatimonadetes bacterium]|nr:hypothetical protein [Gemmatimonadota bacterium]